MYAPAAASYLTIFALVEETERIRVQPMRAPTAKPRLAGRRVKPPRRPEETAFGHVLMRAGAR
jgi:hypothetical protein